MIMFVSLIVFSCNKQTTQPNVKANIDYSNAVWVTPNGKVIPYSERNNWKEYELANFSNEKSLGKSYHAVACSTPEIDCGLLCRKGLGGECNKPEDCIPCSNCGCTPIVNPYE